MPSIFYPGPTFRDHWPIGAGRAGSNIGSGPDVTSPTVLGFEKSWPLNLCTFSGKHVYLMSRLPSSTGHVVTWLHVDLEQATLWQVSPEYLQLLTQCQLFILTRKSSILVCESRRGLINNIIRYSQAGQRRGTPAPWPALSWGYTVLIIIATLSTFHQDIYECLSLSLKRGTSYLPKLISTNVYKRKIMKVVL